VGNGVGVNDVDAVVLEVGIGVVEAVGVGPELVEGVETGVGVGVNDADAITLGIGVSVGITIGVGAGVELISEHCPTVSPCPR